MINEKYIYFIEVLKKVTVFGKLCRQKCVIHATTPTLLPKVHIKNNGFNIGIVNRGLYLWISQMYSSGSGKPDFFTRC